MKQAGCEIALVIPVAALQLLMLTLDFRGGTAVSSVTSQLGVPDRVVWGLSAFMLVSSRCYSLLPR